MPKYSYIFIVYVYKHAYPSVRAHTNSFARVGTLTFVDIAKVYPALYIFNWLHCTTNLC